MGTLNDAAGDARVAPAGEATVRPLHRDDLRFAAALHRRALPHGFFAGLGEPYLRAYYGSFLASPHAVALAAVRDGRPVGVLVGTRNNREHYGWVAHRMARRLALRGALALAARPKVAVSFLRHRAGRYVRALLRMFRASRGPSVPPAGDPEPDVAVLTHVSVDESARGHGVGRTLVRAFLAEASTAGVAEARLVTQADDGAGPFYAALGWRHQGDRPGPDEDTVSAYAISLTDGMPS